MTMRKLVTIAFLLIAASLSAASFAGATAIAVSGTDNSSAYMAFFEGDPALVTPVVVTTPAGPWVGGSWISYNNPDQSWPMDGTSGNLPGTYYYLTSFDLTGLDPATALIKGSWSADNGSELYFNGNYVNTTGTTGYTGLTDFTINNGFLPDLNFLTFVVTNDPWGDPPYTNPTGLLVNIYTATAEPVPEPSTILLLSGGLIGVCVARRRAKR